MSIRLIAQELYRCQREVDRLEKEFDDTTTSDRIEIEESLRRARVERDRLRRVLDGRIGRRRLGDRVC